MESTSASFPGRPKSFLPPLARSTMSKTTCFKCGQIGLIASTSPWRKVVTIIVEEADEGESSNEEQKMKHVELDVDSESALLSLIIGSDDKWKRPDIFSVLVYHQKVSYALVIDGGSNKYIVTVSIKRLGLKPELLP